MSEHLVLVAHGSSRPEWRVAVEALATEVGAEIGAARTHLAYLERCPPTLGEAVAVAVGRGARQIKVLPLFVSPGGHVRRELPRLMEAAAAAHGVRLELLPALGALQEIAAALRAAARRSISA